MMRLELYNYGVIDSLKEARAILSDALIATNKRQMAKLVAEALGLVRAIELVIKVEDDGTECE